MAASDGEAPSAAGALEQIAVEDGLYAAAVRNGLVAAADDRQTWATIKSSLSGGMREPVKLAEASLTGRGTLALQLRERAICGATCRPPGEATALAPAWLPVHGRKLATIATMSRRLSRNHSKLMSRSVGARRTTFL